MIINALIIEDETEIANFIERLLQKYFPNINVCNKVRNVKSSLSSIEKYNPHLLILDIQLGRENSFDLLKNLETPKPEILFITAYDKFAYNAFRENAIDYILKPIDIEVFKKSIAKAISSINYKNNIYPLPKKQSNFIKGSKSKNIINLNEVLYLESNSSYIELKLINNKSDLIIRSLNSIEEELSKLNFIRVNRSSIINLAFIEEINHNDNKVNVTMIDGKIFDISVRRKKKFLSSVLLFSSK